MSAGSASLYWIFLLVEIVLVSADQNTITVESGQDVTLRCRAPINNNKILVVEWSRVDLQTEDVLLYRYDHFAPALQHPSFKKRVDLKDRQMKDGDVSVILEDVTTDHAGTYECRVFMEGAQSWEHTIIYLRVSPPDHKTITADPGQDVTLTCRAPDNNNKIIVVEWSRADLQTEDVLLYRYDHFAPAKQHPSFKKRVDLKDRQMKDGDVSVILKDVTAADEGTYECRVFMEENHRRKRSADPVNTITLSVAPPEPKILITAESGEEVTLTCRAPNRNIKAVEWRRAHLEDKYVLLYQDGHFDSHNQDLSFKNRVDLQDRQMKDGDVSLILKDVTVNDEGTYKCAVFMAETRSWQLSSIINLRVDDLPGQP